MKTAAAAAGIGALSVVPFGTSMLEQRAYAAASAQGLLGIGQDNDLAALQSSVEEVLALEIGSAPGQIGIRIGGTEQPPIGPQSLAVCNGAVYILDTVNSRVEVFGLRTGLQKSLPIRFGVSPFDLQVVGDNEIYVLDMGSD